jgi:SAM-dependent methyltransferase
MSWSQEDEFKRIEQDFTGKIILDAGCGNKKIKCAIGVDRIISPCVDLCCDLDSFPYPFKDSQFDLIVCRDVIEHLQNTVKVITEFYRIIKPGGTLVLLYPHYTYSIAYANPGHVRYFSALTFDRFNPYFKVARRVVSLGKGIKNWLGLSFIANKETKFYEDNMAFIFPLKNIYVELKADKRLNPSVKV